MRSVGFSPVPKEVHQLLVQGLMFSGHESQIQLECLPVPEFMVSVQGWLLKFQGREKVWVARSSKGRCHQGRRNLRSGMGLGRSRSMVQAFVVDDIVWDYGRC